MSTRPTVFPRLSAPRATSVGKIQFNSIQRPAIKNKCDQQVIKHILLTSTTILIIIRVASSDRVKSIFIAARKVDNRQLFLYFLFVISLDWAKQVTPKIIILLKIVANNVSVFGLKGMSVWQDNAAVAIYNQRTMAVNKCS